MYSPIERSLDYGSYCFGKWVERLRTADKLNGLGFRVTGLGFRACRLKSLGFRMQVLRTGLVPGKYGVQGLRA